MQFHEKKLRPYYNYQMLFTIVKTIGFKGWREHIIYEKENGISCFQYNNENTSV